MKRNILLLILLSLTLGACSPFAIQGASGVQPTPVIESFTPAPTQAPVQGIETNTPEPADPASGPDGFAASLQTALEQRDKQAMQALMGASFVIAYWQSEGAAFPAGEAVDQLLANHIGPDSALVFHALQDLPGFDPQAIVGPDVDLAQAIFVTGWGLDAKGEALLLIARRPDESLYWHSVLVALGGFSPPTGAAACSAPLDVPVVNGKVSYQGITFSLPPSLAYAVAVRTCPDAPYSDDMVPGEAHSPYIAFFFPAYDRQNVDFQPEIRVYEIKGDMSQYTYPLNSLAELHSALDQQPEPVGWFMAPLSARQKYLSFGNGAGVRGLVQYMQDFFFYTNNGLLYEYNGLAQDGRFFVSVRYPLSVPFLMELEGPQLIDNVNPQAIAIPEWPGDYEQQRKIVADYNAEALRRLEAMGAGEATPNLADLDALVQSILVK